MHHFKVKGGETEILRDGDCSRGYYFLDKKSYIS